MVDKFVVANARAKKEEARVNDIFAIKQSPREVLRDFLARLNQVRMTLPNVSEGMAVAAFQNRLSKNSSRATRKLLSRLMKYPKLLGMKYTTHIVPKSEQTRTASMG